MRYLRVVVPALLLVIVTGCATTGGNVPQNGQTCFEALQGRWQGEIHDRATWPNGKIRFIEFRGLSHETLSVRFGIPGLYEYAVRPQITFTAPCNLRIFFREPYAAEYSATFDFDGPVLTGQYHLPGFTGMTPFGTLIKVSP